jgi:hypothetical protein
VPPKPKLNPRYTKVLPAKGGARYILDEARLSWDGCTAGALGGGLAVGTGLSNDACCLSPACSCIRRKKKLSVWSNGKQPKEIDASSQGKGASPEKKNDDDFVINSDSGPITAVLFSVLSSVDDGSSSFFFSSFTSFPCVV